MPVLYAFDIMYICLKININMRYIQQSLLLLFVVFMASSFTTDPVKEASEGKINWLSWEEAMEMNKENPKKIFIDLYTDWCGWCKKMDKSTFVDSSVVEYMNENFYAIKFDAEQKEAITFQGHTFNFKKGGRRGSHELASALLNGRMSFPSFVMMTSEMERIMISPGFKKAPEMLKQLKFASEDKYKEMPYGAYEANN